MRTRTRNGVIAEFIPSSHFSGDIPRVLEAHSHWYCEDGATHTVEFRSIGSRWKTLVSGWRITFREDGRALLANKDRAVVDPRSTIVDALSALRRLEASPTDLFVTCALPSQQDADLTVLLPRYDLLFSVRDGKLSCRQVSGTYVPDEQYIGTLFGLHNFLVLQNVGGNDQRIIIPHGPVEIAPGESGHPSIHIRPTATDVRVEFFTYDVDPLLGRLVDDGSTTSRLYLIYLHGLTSFHVRDPLTRTTGWRLCHSSRYRLLISIYFRCRTRNKPLGVRRVVLFPSTRR